MVAVNLVIRASKPTSSPPPPGPGRVNSLEFLKIMSLFSRLSHYLNKTTPNAVSLNAEPIPLLCKCANFNDISVLISSLLPS